MNNKSRLVLGTVQLGMSYGVANAHGAPTKEDAFAILDKAYANGINTFDTAPAYGTAEEVLGEWIRLRALSEKVFVVSKMSFDVPIEESLARLRLARLDGYLLHTPQHLSDERIMGDLHAAKEKGYTAHIGVSMYEPADALRALDLGLDYIQVPYNALDQRLDDTDFFARAKENGVTVFARSPFLQGLLLMSPDRLPAHLAQARPFLERFIAIADKYGLSPLEAALAFVLHSRTDHIVFGAERSEQLAEILEAAGRVSASYEACVEELEGVFKHVEKSIIDPTLWKK